MSLPVELKRAGNLIGEYPEQSVTLMEIKLTVEGQIIVGIPTWIAEKCNEGKEDYIRMLSSIPLFVKDTVEQLLKMQ